MIYKIFSVYDSKAEAYMQPFFMLTKGSALRAWTDTINDPQTQFFKHPTDFTLFEIGEYDDSSGKLINHTAKMSLGVALEYKKDKHAIGNVT